jgi:hypothetical protein
MSDRSDWSDLSDSSELSDPSDSSSCFGMRSWSGQLLSSILDRVSYKRLRPNPLP